MLLTTLSPLHRELSTVVLRDEPGQRAVPRLQRRRILGNTACSHPRGLLGQVRGRRWGVGFEQYYALQGAVGGGCEGSGVYGPGWDCKEGQCPISFVVGVGIVTGKVDGVTDELLYRVRARTFTWL
jgi:hypothetical protein